MATFLTYTLIASGKPYLPEKVYLNVNFGAVDEAVCRSAADFKFTLTEQLPSKTGGIYGNAVICDQRGRYVESSC